MITKEKEQTTLLLMQKEREQICTYSRKLITSNLTTGTGGNISIFNREKGLMAISPSSIPYFDLTPESIVIMDLEGNVVDGDNKPSVEFAMHAIFYSHRQDVNAVVHTHSNACSVMAALHWDLPAANYLVAMGGGPTIPCSKYATYATKELAHAALEAMGKGYAAFLANHGFISAYPTIDGAFGLADEIERCADIFLRAKSVGEPQIIPDEEIYAMLNAASGYNK
ncbi:MAG: L-fuculose-phosphate aldolase [Streptococcaceae bacterium]|jgi:L-fuculose-phosphate aldolase|nr:L-fuculose-phosphate aldolase [Streptococcaceae bacterium]